MSPTANDCTYNLTTRFRPNYSVENSASPALGKKEIPRPYTHTHTQLFFCIINVPLPLFGAGAWSGQLGYIPFKRSILLLIFYFPDFNGGTKRGARARPFVMSSQTEKTPQSIFFFFFFYLDNVIYLSLVLGVTIFSLRIWHHHHFFSLCVSLSF